MTLEGGQAHEWTRARQAGNACVVLTKRAQAALFSSRMCRSRAGCHGSQVCTSWHSHHVRAKLEAVPRHDASCSRAHTASRTEPVREPVNPRAAETEVGRRINNGAILHSDTSLLTLEPTSVLSAFTPPAFCMAQRVDSQL